MDLKRNQNRLDDSSLTPDAAPFLRSLYRKAFQKHLPVLAPCAFLPFSLNSLDQLPFLWLHRTALVMATSAVTLPNPGRFSGLTVLCLSAAVDTADYSLLPKIGPSLGSCSSSYLIGQEVFSTSFAGSFLSLAFQHCSAVEVSLKLFSV